MHVYPNPDKPEPNSKFEARKPTQIEDPCSKLQGMRSLARFKKGVVRATADCLVHKTETGEFVKDRSARPTAESGAAPPTM